LCRFCPNQVTWESATSVQYAGQPYNLSGGYDPVVAKQMANARCQEFIKNRPAAEKEMREPRCEAGFQAHDGYAGYGDIQIAPPNKFQNQQRVTAPPQRYNDVKHENLNQSYLHGYHTGYHPGYQSGLHK